MAKFICVTNNIFNSYPMNNGDNVWEPGFRVGENGDNVWELGLGWGKRENIGKHGLFMVGEIGENFDNRVLGGKNGKTGM